MTNSEYETASVQAAMGHRKLAAVDKQIEQVESTLVFLLHSRREIVNQYDLNKPTCPHDSLKTEPDGVEVRCNKCDTVTARWVSSTRVGGNV
jgi:hypothetical protein